jgi:hypothetical protein
LYSGDQDQPEGQSPPMKSFAITASLLINIVRSQQDFEEIATYVPTD